MQRTISAREIVHISARVLLLRVSLRVKYMQRPEMKVIARSVTSDRRTNSIQRPELEKIIFLLAAISQGPENARIMRKTHPS